MQIAIFLASHLFQSFWNVPLPEYKILISCLILNSQRSVSTSRFVPRFVFQILHSCPRIYRGALWILGEYCSTKEDIQSVMTEVRRSLGEVCLCALENCCAGRAAQWWSPCPVTCSPRFSPSTKKEKQQLMFLSSFTFVFLLCSVGAKEHWKLYFNYPDK